MASRFRYFIAVSPGLEPLLLQELQGLGIAGTVTPGGVECAGGSETLWTLHWHCRLAESVRLRLKPFDARSFAELEQGLARLPWHAYRRPGAPFKLSVTCQRSRLYHTKAIVERVERLLNQDRKAAPATAPRPPPPRDAELAPTEAGTPASSAELKIHVRVMNNRVQVSIDASGERLHRRGYRTHVGEAPIRETLAAAAIQLLLALEPDRRIERLWDPCCGSGTLLGEWLLPQVGGVPPGLRSFAFETWPIHDAAAYLAWTLAQRRTTELDGHCRAFGSDRDERSIRAARHNLELAGVSNLCELHEQDFRAAALQIPLHTAVVSNLPYGVRLQDQPAANRLFLAVDRLLYERSDLRPALVLTTLPPPVTALGSWQRLATFANGGLRVNALALTVARISPLRGIVETSMDPAVDAHPADKQ